MRRVAVVPSPKDEIRRIILHESDGGTYLYLSKKLEDAGADYDEWYATTSEAESRANATYGITSDLWEAVSDPLPGCQHDWIAPVRVAGRDPSAVEFERLVDGKWTPLTESR